MIRINLLGTAKGKKGGKRAAAVATSSYSSGPNIGLVVLIVFLVMAAANGAWYWKLNRDATQIATDLGVAEQENRRLAEVKARYLEREKQKNEYQQRVNVIEQLRANQSGPVTLLATVGETVSNTDAVWLSTMVDKGNTVDIEGRALSVKSVANLMQNLQRTGYFKSVEMKESVQDEKVKDMQAFNFTLTCEKAPAPKPGETKS